MTPEQFANGMKLVNALRRLPDEGDPEGFTRLPEDGLFKWDFRSTLEEENCGRIGCAMGVAKLIGLVDELSEVLIADKIGILYYEANEIFFKPRFYGKEHSFEITPHMVAAVLEECLLHHQKE